MFAGDDVADFCGDYKTSLVLIERAQTATGNVRQRRDINWSASATLSVGKNGISMSGAASAGDNSASSGAESSTGGGGLSMSVGGSFHASSSRGLDASASADAGTSSSSAKADSNGDSGATSSSDSSGGWW